MSEIVNRGTAYILEFAASAVDTLAAANLSGPSLAEAASELLRQLGPITLEDFLRFLSDAIRTESSGLQVTNPRFGQPSLTVCQKENVAFEFILWENQITAIHEHTFNGAFKAISGRRLQFSWRLDAQRTIEGSGGVSLGDLVCSTLDMLDVGDVVEIHRGKASIHSLWSIDRPVLTALIRERGDRTGDSYLPPGMAYKEAPAEKHYLARAAMLSSLHRHSRELYAEALLALGAELPLNHALYYAQMRGISPSRPEEWGHFTKGIEKVHSSLLPVVAEALSHDERHQEAVRLGIGAELPSERAALALFYYGRLLDGIMRERLEGLVASVEP